MNPTFWTVFKADLLFSVCSITLGIVITLVMAKVRKKKQQGAKTQKYEGPRVVVVGGDTTEPSHCPLCGRDWPLPGPVGPPKEV